MQTTLPRINARNIIAEVATGVTTMYTLGRLFGVAEDDGRLLLQVCSLIAAGRLSMSVGDLPILTLTGGTR